MPGGGLSGNLGTQRCRAGEHLLQATTGRNCSTIGCLASASTIGGTARNRVTFLSWIRVECLLQVEPRHRDHGAPVGEHPVHQHLHAVDVEERQHARARPRHPRRTDHGSIWTMLATRLRWVSIDPLGQPGRAGGVGQHHHVVVEVHRHLLDRIAAAGRRTRPCRAPRRRSRRSRSTSVPSIASRAVSTNIAMVTSSARRASRSWKRTSSAV